MPAHTRTEPPRCLALVVLQHLGAWPVHVALKTTRGFAITFPVLFHVLPVAAAAWFGGCVCGAVGQLINEKPGVVNEYESGRAIPVPAMLSKLERALGVRLPRPAKKK